MAKDKAGNLFKFKALVILAFAIALGMFVGLNFHSLILGILFIVALEFQQAETREHLIHVSATIMTRLLIGKE